MAVIFGLSTSILTVVFFILAAMGLLLYSLFDRMPRALAVGSVVMTTLAEIALILVTLVGFHYNVGDQFEDLAEASRMSGTLRSGLPPQSVASVGTR